MYSLLFKPSAADHCVNSTAYFTSIQAKKQIISDVMWKSFLKTWKRWRLVVWCVFSPDFLDCVIFSLLPVATRPPPLGCSFLCCFDADLFLALQDEEPVHFISNVLMRHQIYFCELKTHTGNNWKPNYSAIHWFNGVLYLTDYWLNVVWEKEGGRGEFSCKQSPETVIINRTLQTGN